MPRAYRVLILTVPTTDSSHVPTPSSPVETVLDWPTLGGREPSGRYV